MHPLVAILAVLLISLVLAEFFVVFLLPRRVKRDPRLARGLLAAFWSPWRALAARLPRVAADTFLGIFGPLGLLAILGLLSTGMIFGFAGLQWALGEHLSPRGAAGFGSDLFFSAGAFFSATTPVLPSGGGGRALQILEAAGGLSFLAIAIGYLPALFQAFSRRETAVSRLDPRAGSPPTAGALLASSGMYGGWRELDTYLREWESWTAELMETHLSYPILGYFRSQHVNQNWLAALTAVVDACAYAIAYGPEQEIEAARLTFRIGRHALADLAHAFTARHVGRLTPQDSTRLDDAQLLRLRAQLEGSGLHTEDAEESRVRLTELRQTYEHYAIALARHLALALPDWVAEEVQQNWRAATQHGGPHHLLP